MDKEARDYSTDNTPSWFVRSVYLVDSTLLSLA